MEKKLKIKFIKKRKILRNVADVLQNLPESLGNYPSQESWSVFPTYRGINPALGARFFSRALGCFGSREVSLSLNPQAMAAPCQAQTILCCGAVCQGALVLGPELHHTPLVGSGDVEPPISP